jgi:hypothetical protein
VQVVWSAAELLGWCYGCVCTPFNTIVEYVREPVIEGVLAFKQAPPPGCCSAVSLVDMNMFAAVVI